MTCAVSAPEVSIVLLTHNAGPDLDRVLDAVLAQEDAPPFEVIAIDTESTDGTRERLERRPVRRLDDVQINGMMSLYRSTNRRTAMAGGIQRKNYRIDMRKLERTRRALGTRTETETIHRALDLVADELALARALRTLVLKGKGRIESLDADR